MKASEILEIIQQGESSKVQFKEKLPHTDSLAHELIAFSNSKGGIILIGINDKTGSQSVFPSIIIDTEVLNVSGQNVMLVDIAEGTNKPYKDRLGTIYLKNGSDKRRVSWSKCALSKPSIVPLSSTPRKISPPSLFSIPQMLSKRLLGS